jgi:hypothetical protein
MLVLLNQYIAIIHGVNNFKIQIICLAVSPLISKLNYKSSICTLLFPQTEAKKWQSVNDLFCQYDATNPLAPEQNAWFDVQQTEI